MSQKKKVALVMSSVLLMSQMGFADVAKEEVAKDAQEQVVLKKDKKGTDAAAEAEAMVADNSADEQNEG